MDSFSFNKLKPVSVLACGISALFISSTSFAWSNYFRFVNNFNYPLTVSITPTLASVSSTCGGNVNAIDMAPRTNSCEIQFDTAQEHWYSAPANSGTITLAMKNDPKSYCTYNYNYTYSLVPYSYFDIHSENISLQSCQGNLRPYEISVINDHNEALPKPLVGNVILGLDQNKAADVTESLSQADCGGNSGDNCMIASPDLNTHYLSNGSTLAEAIALQTVLDRYEPLNFEQFIGSHNAAISRQYTTSTSSYNLSYADPDNYMSLTDQLNSGVRQIELDIQWYNNAVTICHNHVSSSLQGILCDGNSPISTALTEIKTWVEKNPTAFVFIYLDVNLPLAGHVTDLDAELAKLDPYVFTPAMANQYYQANNALPAYQLSQDDLINKYKKNIIVTNDDDVDNLKTSQYAFVAVKNTSSTPLTENSVSTITSSVYGSCNTSAKYSNIKNIYTDDPNHYNLYRINSDRTAIDYLNSVGDLSPSQYTNYFTTQNLTNLLDCPVNVFSTNMLGFTCDSNNCNTHPTDPKLYSFLWSWSLGYPLQTGSSNLAYINPQNGHFENNTLTPNSTYSVLCVHGPSLLPGPTAPLPYYIQNVKIMDAAHADDVAALACNMTGGAFVTPTTSYWMHDAMSVINANGINPNNVLVNYENVNGQWIPNYVKMSNGLKPRGKATI